MHALVEQTQRTITQYGMAKPGARVLAAVSGGADSVFLVHALQAIGFDVGIAHFDHQTRDGASAADAAFVRALAEARGVPHYHASQPVAEEAAASSMSFEEYAREARYAALLQMAIDHEYRIIATGHHADDLAETVLMRVLRGTSPGGLAGIPPVRTQQGIAIVRPLLQCRRAAIEAYLRDHGADWVTDATNTDTAYMRNRVRHDLLPQLRAAYNPQVDDALVRIADVQREENEYLNGLARKFLSVCCPDGRAIRRVPFATAPVALQRRGLVLVGWHQGIETPFDRIDPARRFILDAPSGAAFDLGGGVLLRNSRDVTEVLRDATGADRSETPLAMPGETVTLGKRFRVRALEALPDVPLAQYCHATRQVFDADALGDAVTVRTRRDGDRFTPYGMTGTKKLKAFFIDKGVTHGERDRTPLIVSGDRIAWIVGHTIGAEFAVMPSSKRWIEIEVDNAPAP